MTPVDALIALAIFLFVVIPLAVAVCALSRIHNANESDRLGAALGVEFRVEPDAFAADGSWPPDPAKTAGGAVGKTYTGGCGDQLYPANPAVNDEYDHHTNDAIYRSEQGEQPTRTERLP